MACFLCCAPGEPVVDTVLRSRSLELATNDTTAHSSITSANDYSEKFLDSDTPLPFPASGRWVQ